MNRSLKSWTLYGLGMFLALGAMLWVTRVALRTEKAEASARSKAALEEKVRQAIWRMDSNFSLFLSTEAARPYYHYNAFHSADRIFTRDLSELDRREVLMPSPLLSGLDSLVKLRFQVDRNNQFSSPLAPPKAYQSLARRVGLSAERISQNEARLRECAGRLSWQDIHQSMTIFGSTHLESSQIQDLRNQQTTQGLNSPYQLFQSAWVPFWKGDALFMVRQVWVEDRELLQGCWLDEGELKEVLQSTMRDLLPSVEFMPVHEPRKGMDTWRMASLPIRIQPGPLPVESQAGSSFVRLSLGLGWACLLSAGLLGAWLLGQAIAFGEQRSAFVSSVTHELRTPLTTFRLYAEMLAMGMIPESEKPSYLQTLLFEANRLDHLVKNVLSFARMEGRSPKHFERICVGDVMDRSLPRLRQRAQEAGMELDFRVEAGLNEANLNTDAALVEQIFFNLVDNACKYAACGKRIELDVESAGTWICFQFRDHGPGIPKDFRRHLFKPFRRASQEAGKPGVGLGLAMCQRLARNLGGKLESAAAQPGALFRLYLPISSTKKQWKAPKPPHQRR